MVTFLTVLHLLVCVFLIIVVLLQAGKGGGMGIAFGGGGSQTVFGSSGAGNFLTKLTSVTAFLFLVTSLGLAHYSSQQDSKRLQRLADRKTEEKKVEDERASKLKSELDKARESAKKMPSGDTAPAPNSSDLPAGALPSGKPGELKLTAPKVGGEPETKPAAPGAKTKVKAKAEGTDGETKAAAPADAPKPKKKRAPAPPAGEGETNAAPAEAPAPPAQ